MSLSSLLTSLREVVRPIATRNVHTVRGGLATGLRRRGGSDYFPRKLTSEEAFLQSLDLRGKTVYDIGAHIGLFTLFFARAVGDGGRVIGFEPHPGNFEAALGNVSLNRFRNVEMINIGVGAAKGTALMTTSARNPALSTFAEPERRLLEQHRDATHLTLAIDALDNIVAQRNLPSPGFVKIDVEGLEFGVLTGMARTMANARPSLLIEMHWGELDEKPTHAARVVGFLHDRGYLVSHVQTMQPIPQASAALPIKGHLYATPA